MFTNLNFILKIVDFSQIQNWCPQILRELKVPGTCSWQWCILHVLLFKSDQRHQIFFLWYCCTPIVQFLLAKNFQSIPIPIKWGKNWIDNLLLVKLPLYWQPASHTIIDLNLNTCNKLNELTNDLHLWKLTLTLTELANSIIKRVPLPLYYDIIHLSKYSISHYLCNDLVFVFVFKRPRALPSQKTQFTNIIPNIVCNKKL